jgi:xanthine dehydrogenase accessory factor
MENIWDRAKELLLEGKPFVLATIIRTRGSTPREVGAKMVVPPEGQPFGTIGGGCGEGEVLRRAYPLFQGHESPRVVEVDLTGDFSQDEIQICGGLMDVALDLWKPDQDRELAHTLAEAARLRRPTALVTLIDPVPSEALPAGAKSCLSLNRDEVVLTPPLPLGADSLRSFTASVSAGKPHLFCLSPEGGAVEEAVARNQNWPHVFVDVLPGLQTLVIVGAGHIAQPLCEIGHLLGFRTVVIDDRWAFANRERFPNAHDLRVGNFVNVLEELEINDQTFVVVVTRGHNWDEASVRTVLKKRPAYIGMIGSKRRAKATLERLTEHGYGTEDLQRIHTPMGLDLAAETPAEIAVAIAAEIIRVRRRGPLETVSLAAKARPSGPYKFTG